MQEAREPAADGEGDADVAMLEEYLVKWKGMSHIHCQWVPRDALEFDPMNRQKLHRSACVSVRVGGGVGGVVVVVVVVVLLLLLLWLLLLLLVVVVFVRLRVGTPSHPRPQVHQGQHGRSRRRREHVGARCGGGRGPR